MSKSALTMLSEIVGLADAAGNIALNVQFDAEKHGNIEVPPEDEELFESGKQIEEVESQLVFKEDADGASKVVSGCFDIRRLAVEMIKLCVEWEPPL